MEQTRILLCGACGKMGGNVLSLLAEQADAVAVCGVDLYPREIGIPVYKSFSEIQEEVDVIIDFSSPIGLQERLEYAKTHSLGIVLASTGFTQDDLKLIDEYAQEVAIFRTANLSLGVNLMQALCQMAVKVLGEQFDVEAFDGKKEYVYGREGIVGAREKKEIGIHAVRGGTIVGEHEVLFAGEDEMITITHTATSKRVFASGAIRAAKFLKGKVAGMYEMKHLLAEENA